jgi:hypothetical protein
VSNRRKEHRQRNIRTRSIKTVHPPSKRNTHGNNQNATNPSTDPENRRAVATPCAANMLAGGINQKERKKKVVMSFYPVLLFEPFQVFLSFCQVLF